MSATGVTIDDALGEYRRNPSPPERVGHVISKLVSTLGTPADRDDIARAWPGRELPSDALALWAACSTARLFEDVVYGQWGLVLFNPSASAERTARELLRRPNDLRSDDVVIGEFLGDQELLVLAPSNQGERRVLVALPIDPREDWFGAAAGLAQFLVRYFDHGGDKYWE